MMRLFLAALAGAGLAACTPADPAARAEQMWARCDGQALAAQRLSACSDVIDYSGTEPMRRAAAFVNRGAIRANEGDTGRAIADFGRAVRIDPRNTQALYQRGLVHENRGAYEAALRDYDLALAIDPTMQLAAERREAALQGQGERYRDQLAQITEQLLNAPTNPELLNARCWLRVTNNDDLDAALSDCNAAILASPRFAAALDSRGLVHLKRGEFAASITDYEAALQIEPASGHYLYGRGLARIRAGQVTEGQADLVAAERAQPGVTALYASYGVRL